MRISDWSSDVCSSDLESCRPGLQFRLLVAQTVGEPQALAEGVDAPEPARRHGRSAVDPLGAGQVDAWRAESLVEVMRGEADAALGQRQAEGRLHGPAEPRPRRRLRRSEEHTSELQSLMRISYAVFCLKQKNNNTT